VMVVEHAERFGLSQLHQLRGRVGRGPHPSYCLLVAYDPITDDARARLNAMLHSTDGFVIAEEDLAIRGPGDFLGTRQSGLPDLKVADLIRDFKLLGLVRGEAFDLIDRDPHLQKPEHSHLKQILHHRLGGRLNLLNII